MIDSVGQNESFFKYWPTEPYQSFSIAGSLGIIITGICFSFLFLKDKKEIPAFDDYSLKRKVILDYAWPIKRDLARNQESFIFK